MGRALRGSARAAAIWHDPEKRAGAAAGASGILPEDAFDMQPIVTDECAFVSQARLDNRDEILTTIALPRERWSGISDGEVLFHAYRRWGRDCVQHVFGDYAFAAWDRQSGELVAAADHLATVPVYYCQIGRRLVLSTQLGSLLAHPQVPRDPDLKALGLLVAPKIQAASTPFLDICMLRGGHLLRARNGQVSIDRWWRPATGIAARFRKARDYVGEARELFDRGVQARMRAVGGVAATLSGGLDSTLVAATAAMQLGDKGATLDVYTSIPEPDLACSNRPGWDADDSGFAASVAAMQSNMRHILVNPAGRSPLDIVPDVHARSRTPIRNGGNIVWMSRMAQMAAASGRRVMLVGDKGNAVLSPSADWLTGDCWSLRSAGLVLRLLANAARDGGRPLWRSLPASTLGPRLRARAKALWGQPPAAPRGGLQFLAPEFRARWTRELETFAGSTGRAALAEFAMSPYRGWAADPLPQWGIVHRDPIGDRRLIEAVLTYPWEALFADERDRGLARAMGEGRVPDDVRFRRTRGEQTPELAAAIVAQRTAYLSALDRAARSQAYRSVVAVDRVRETIETLRGDGTGRLVAHAVVRAIDVGLFLAECGV